MRKSTIVAVLLGAVPVMAQARPVLHPQHDVVVQYRVTGPQGPSDSGEVTIHYAMDGQRMRIEPAGRPSYMIVDRAAQRMDVVMPAQQIYIQLPYDPRAIMKFEDKDAKFTPHGSETVAGLHCTVYQVRSRGGSGQICLTDDGVMLQAEGQGSHPNGSLEAVQVRYAAQPASLFAPPPGFRKLEPAQRPPQGAAPAQH